MVSSKSFQIQFVLAKFGSEGRAVTQSNVRYVGSICNRLALLEPCRASGNRFFIRSKRRKIARPSRLRIFIDQHVNYLAVDMY